MSHLIELALTVVAAVLASSGFWAFIQSRRDKKDAKTQMILGLGHDRILTQGMEYIKRGWITPDEYENLYEYLYKPYERMGGNGSAKKIMNEINHLPTKPNNWNIKIEEPIYDGN